MSILIKGMEMPKNCHECRLYEGDIYYCSAADKMIDISDSSEERCQFCPLVPVPPHGRLIDADALAEHKFVCIPHVSIDGKDAGTAYRLGWNTAIEAVMENAETIIGENDVR